MDGGIASLVRLSRTHRAELEYDLRSRLHFALCDVGAAVRTDEAARLVRLLTIDPTSKVGAALQGLDFAPSREWLLLADLYDLTARAHYKKPKPYPRPWPNEADRKRIGNTGGRSRDEVLAILARVGHAIAGKPTAPDVKEVPDV